RAFAHAGAVRHDEIWLGRTAATRDRRVEVREFEQREVVGSLPDREAHHLRRLRRVPERLLPPLDALREGSALLAREVHARLPAEPDPGAVLDEVPKAELDGKLVEVDV